MGQLERYGLYVLCLVIFLILGVAIWGDGEGPDSTKIDVMKGSATVLKDDKEKGDEFEELMKRESKRTSYKQRKAEEQLFKPADADAKRTKILDPVEADIKKIVAPIPRPVALRTHVVKDGDNLEALSQRYLGKGHLWHKIKAINPGVDEMNLKLGAVLKIPARGGLGAGSVAGGGRYLVRKGDSAWRIARKRYGLSKATEYSKRILQLNGITDETALKPGTYINLPK